MEKEIYKRLYLKNGWDLPAGEKPPLTGRKQYLLRAYELLVKKEDSEYESDYYRAQNRAKEEPLKKDRADMEGTDTERIGARSDSFTDRDGFGRTDSVKEAGKSISGAESGAKEIPDEQDILAQARAGNDDVWKARRRFRFRLITGILAAAVVICWLRLAFGPAILTADISAYQDVTIEIVGISDQPFLITPAELSSMKKKAISVPVHEGEVAADEIPETGKAIGPTLDTFLKKYGKTTDDFRSMRVYTQKETSTAYVRTMKEEELILSIANGRKPLGEKQAPLRIASESMRAEEWSGWIRRIEFVS